jgi:hypothetical protein
MVVRISDELPAGYELSNPAYGTRIAALSPDGALLAVSLRGPDRRTHIHTRLLRETAWRLLDGSESGLFPFFSPDGAWIGFSAENRIKKIPAAGGPPVELGSQSTNGFRGATWGADGYIYYGSIGGWIRRFSASGGPIEPVGKAPVRGYWPQILPGGKSLLFTDTAFNLDSSTIKVLSLESGEVKTVLQEGFSAVYLEPPGGAGRLLYMHGTSILAVPFHLNRLATEGVAQPLAEGAASNDRGGDFTASNNGVLAYVAGKAERRIPTSISWVDRSGKSSVLYSTPGVYNNPRLSPDGKRIAFTVATATNNEIWVKDLDRDTATRLTFINGRSDWAFWTPDSRSILFNADGDLYWVDADGSGTAEVIAPKLNLNQGLGSFTADGKKLVFAHQSGLGAGGGYVLATASIEEEAGRRKLGRVEAYLATPYDQRHPALSPDGKWIAYDSLEAGAVEVYVRPFPGPGGKWRVSNGGGLQPIWFRNGRELLYHNPSTGRAMVASYSVDGSEFKPGRPEPWSDTPFQGNPVYRFYDLAPDGLRLAVIGLNDEVAPAKPPTSIRFLIDWPAVLRSSQ